MSWYQPRPDVSLDLITTAAPDRDAAIIDIGGGTSALTDHLLDRGYSDITVLDISEAALKRARERLGAEAGRAGGRQVCGGPVGSEEARRCSSDPAKQSGLPTTAS